MPRGDRYDAWAAIVGLPVLLVGALVVGHGGLAAWASSLAIASGLTNMTSFGLRRRARASLSTSRAGASLSASRRAGASLSASELRRRLPIVVGGVVLVIFCAVALRFAFGKSAIIPAMGAAVIIGVAMLWAMLRPGSRR